MLCQNFPNPFNTITTLSYFLPELSFVNLSIYNETGQLVTILVSEEQVTGYHNVAWDASKLSSGIYLYRLKTCEYSANGKCLLLKWGGATNC